MRVKGSGAGGGEREEKMPACFFFSPPPLPFPSFSLAPTPLCLKGGYFYSPQCSSVIKINGRWQQKQYEHKQAFAYSKYACTAGYSFMD